MNLGDFNTKNSTLNADMYMNNITNNSFIINTSDDNSLNKKINDNITIKNHNLNLNFFSNFYINADLKKIFDINYHTNLVFSIFQIILLITFFHYFLRKIIFTQKSNSKNVNKNQIYKIYDNDDKKKIADDDDGRKNGNSIYFFISVLKKCKTGYYFSFYSYVLSRFLIIIYWNLDQLNSRYSSRYSDFELFPIVSENLKKIHYDLILPKMIIFINIFNFSFLLLFYIKMKINKKRDQKFERQNQNNIFLLFSFLILCHVHSLYSLTLGFSSSPLFLFFIVHIFSVFNVVHFLFKNNYNYEINNYDIDNSSNIKNETTNKNKNINKNNNENAIEKIRKKNKKIVIQYKRIRIMSFHNYCLLIALILHIMIVAKLFFFFTGHSFDFSTLQVR